MDWLREIRDKENKSQQNCAEEIGITQQAYSHIENGKRGVRMDSKLARKIAQALHFKKYGLDWTAFYPDEASPTQSQSAVGEQRGAQL